MERMNIDPVICPACGNPKQFLPRTLKKHPVSLRQTPCKQCWHKEQVRRGDIIRIQKIGVMMCRGLTFKQIAAELAVTEDTIYCHWSKMKRMAKTDSPCAFAIWMVEQGHYKVRPVKPLALSERVKLFPLGS